MIVLLLSVLIGVSVGSFLNVVIYRLPIILRYEWQQLCAQLPHNSLIYNLQKTNFNLLYPRSHCPQCKHSLRIRDNIPCLSYVYLRGKCRYCQQYISPRYLLIEIITAVMSVFLIWHFNLTWQAFTASIFGGYLLTLVMIDIDEHLLPDILTLSLLWLGLTVNLFGLFTDIHSAIIGVLTGYLSLWLLSKGFSTITGKIGMGHGDFKLFAALGAWLGWQTLPFVILIASIMGTLAVLTLIAIKGYKRDTPIAFGPFLALAGWLNLLLGQQLLKWYL
ncbi:A24 family peptidase [soil metagenome]